MNKGGAKKKAHRFRKGTVAIREIRRYQKDTSLLIPKLPFERLVREIAQEYKNDIKFSKKSFEVLQVGLESFMHRMFEDAVLNAKHNRRCTIMPKDLQLARRICKEYYEM